MLLETVHLPEIYGNIPDLDEYSGTYCSLLIGILEDMLTNCILYIDNSDQINGSILSSLEHWPPKYRTRVQKIWRALADRRRLVKLDCQIQAGRSCGFPGCDEALSLASSLSARELHLVLCSNACAICYVINDNGLSFVNLQEYAISSFYDVRRKLERIELAENQWNKVRFEREVWEPLFRHTKYVRIVDRILGHHVYDRVAQNQKYPIGANFSSSLDWICGQFSMLTAGRPDRGITIICGLPEPSSPSPVKRAEEEAIAGQAAKAIREFVRSLGQKHGIPVTVRVKLEGASGQLRHARFIFTDQVSLMVERGFDLLNSSGGVRNVIITHVSEAGKIEAEALRLPEAR